MRVVCFSTMSCAGQRPVVRPCRWAWAGWGVGVGDRVLQAPGCCTRGLGLVVVSRRLGAVILCVAHGVVVVVRSCRERRKKKLSACRGEGSAVGLQLRVRFVPAALLAMLRTALALQCVSKARDWTSHKSCSPLTCSLSATNRHCWRSSEPVLMQRRRSSFPRCCCAVLCCVAVL
jgi:hypothetical protein